MSAEASYGRVDRLLHEVAFRAVTPQLALADIEERLFASQLASVEPAAPVFVTSLARAGTTMLLELLASLRGFASHTYRDMPFVLCPMVWDRLSARFRTADQLRERAHGDGIAINADSPEAFEEIIWKAFYPRKYRDDRILPWGPEEADPDFEAFLRQHMRKIVALRRPPGDAGPGWRYVSKNNANIARLKLLRAMFPDCRIVIPVRSPWNHCQSLMRQHERFTIRHRDDAFGLKYMIWLGHFEFGAALRPIDFDGWLDRTAGLGPESPAFWLAYWEAAYRHILDAAPEGTAFLDYDTLCERPEEGLRDLAAAVGIDAGPEIMGLASRVRASTQYPSGQRESSASLPADEGARAIYERLLERCRIRVDA